MKRTAAAPMRLHSTSHPLVYEINTRILLRELSAAAGKSITLGTIPDAILDEWAGLHFDAIWMMGVWTTGESSAEIARGEPGLAAEFQKALPDYVAGDVGGSPYAITSFTVPRAMGGTAGLRKLRGRLAERGLGLILDFVHNHTAIDSPWVTQHPEYFVGGTAADLEAEPGNYFAVTRGKETLVLAHGRDPSFPAWTDTAQINLMHEGARKAMVAQLLAIAGECDGVRCDMAMLALRDVFMKRWGERALRQNPRPAEGEFWQEAIATVRAAFPRFLFVAEAYWDLEWSLQQLGFDFTYDKRLYDRLRREGSASARAHLMADLDFQRHLVRFIENHDEPRAASAFGSEGWHFATAVVVATVPGMFLIHEGQLDGRRVKTPLQLLRRAEEPFDDRARAFYGQLMACLKDPVFRNGRWLPLEPKPAWYENQTWQDVIAGWWEGESSGRLVVVNYAPHSAQCYLPLPLDRMACQSCEFKDLMSEAHYVRDRQGIVHRGMYFDLPAYGFHLFNVCKSPV